MTPYFSQDCIQIYHAKAQDIIHDLPKGLTVTDPPYNVGYHYEQYSDNLPVEEYQELLRTVCPLPCVVIHYMEDLCAMSWTLEEIPERVVAWVYPSNTARQWRGIAWWGCKPDFTKDGQPYKNPNDSRIKKRMARGEQARLYDWWEVNQVKNVSEDKTDHPCQIPIEVMLKILRITPAELVIDPFCGSGTTLLAASMLGIKAIGIEMNENYCELASQRIENNKQLI